MEWVLDISVFNFSFFGKLVFCMNIYNIIDSRYRSRKPLIVTTNLTLTELKNPQDTAHARIYDRLLELCTPIACTGPSMRKNIGQAKLNLLKTLLA